MTEFWRRRECWDAWLLSCWGTDPNTTRAKHTAYSTGEMFMSYTTFATVTISVLSFFRMRTLREMSKSVVIKFGLQPRKDLPDSLPEELDSMEERIRLDITGDYYADYHIQDQHACEVNLNWSSGEWSFVLRHYGVQHEAQLRAGRRTYLGYEWKKIFLFTSDAPFPGLQDIVIYDFVIQLDQRSVWFYGHFYNQYSGNMVVFRTKFRFSITSHFMKVQTEFLIGGMFLGVGQRFLRQPDTQDLDFFRWGGQLITLTYMNLPKPSP